jgi:hypothetical protein
VWTEGVRDIAFLLEYDTGSEHLPQLTDKLHGYADLARRPSGLALRMPILFCFPTPRREQTARKARVATALDPRVSGPAWMPLHGGHGPMRLIDLDDVLPDPWRAARAEDERRERERQERERRELAARQLADEADDPLWPHER